MISQYLNSLQGVVRTDPSSFIPLAILEAIWIAMMFSALTRRRAPFWNGWLKTYYVERDRSPVAYWLVVAALTAFGPAAFLAWTWR